MLQSDQNLEDPPCGTITREYSELEFPRELWMEQSEMVETLNERAECATTEASGDDHLVLSQELRERLAELRRLLDRAAIDRTNHAMCRPTSNGTKAI
jgi:hypothetical protein